MVQNLCLIGWERQRKEGWTLKTRCQFKEEMKGRQRSAGSTQAVLWNTTRNSTRPVCRNWGEWKSGPGFLTWPLMHLKSTSRKKSILSDTPHARQTMGNAEKPQKNFEHWNFHHEDNKMNTYFRKVRPHLSGILKKKTTFFSPPRFAACFHYHFVEIL